LLLLWWLAVGYGSTLAGWTGVAVILCCMDLSVCAGRRVGEVGHPYNPTTRNNTTLTPIQYNARVYRSIGCQ